MPYIFIGTEGSMGFRKGIEYTLETYIGHGLLWIHCEKPAVNCCYESIELFLKNWKTKETE